MKFLFIIVSLTFLSCNQKAFNSKESFLEYLQDVENGYNQKEKINSVDFSLMYKPTDLIILHEVEVNNKINIDSLRNEYDKYLYFNLSISFNNQELLKSTTKENYISLLNQLAFGMKDKIYLETRKKRIIPLLDYIYPRTYEMGNSTSILLLFENDSLFENNDHIELVINDFGLNTGRIKFNIDSKKILNQPKYTFKL